MNNDPSCAEIFADYFILERENAKWGKPSVVYIDSPFLNTGLRNYYDALGDKTNCSCLSSSYKNSGIDIKKLVAFCKAVGVKYKLHIVERSCYENPQWDYLGHVPGERDTSPINRDYMIDRLDELLQSPSLELSKLVWTTMSSLDTQYLQARYQKNWSNGARYADSQLVHVLQKMAWVPQKNGEFVRLCDAAREELPKGFPFDEGMEWIERVKFGENAKKRSEEYQIRNQQAKNIGFSSADEAHKMAELLKLLKKNGKSPDDLIAQLKPNMKKEKPAFPTRISANPERRQERLAEQRNEATDKEYEQRNRSVRTTKGTVDEKQWLKKQYTNNAGQMICQLCKKEMPFKKRDGEFYFEAVEALSRDHFTKEHEAQFLSLCPLCAAMYKEFVKQDEVAMECLKDDLITANDLELHINLGDREASLRFVETHINDLKVILRKFGDNID